MANGTGALGLGVDDGLGETSSPLPSAAPVDEVPGATASALPSAAPVDEGLGATAAPLRPAAPAPGVPPTPDGSAGRRGLPGSRTDSVANGGDSRPQARGVCVDEGLVATSSPLRLAAPQSCVPLAPGGSGRGAGGGVRDICDEVVERLVAGGRLDPGAIDVQLRTLLEEHFCKFLERPDASGRSAGGGVRDICDEVVEGLVAGGRLDPGAIDFQFRGLLEEHFGRLPLSYQQYARVIKAEEVFMHMKLLKEAAEANLLPPLHVQFCTVERLILEATDMDVLKESDGAVDASSTRSAIICSNVHEIVFGYIRSPKLRAQLSSVLADLGLSIMHMHLFTRSDGYFLDVFTVAGWPEKDTVNLVETLQESILRHKRSWFGSESASFGTPAKLLTYSSSYNTPSKSPAYSSSYNTPAESLSSVRTHSSRTGRQGSIRRLQIIKKRKRAERVKQEKIMESFKAILSSFLFPSILAIFTSNFSFGEYEKPFFIMFFALGGMLILLAMVLSHGVEDGPGRTVVVSRLTLGAVIYVFSVLMYCLYKFVFAESNQVMALYNSVMHFILGVVMLIMLWENLFK